MKHKNILVTLALYALIQAPLCFGSETQQSPSYWQQYAPTRAQNLATVAANKASNAYTTSRDYAATWVPQSVKDRVNTWSTKKKMAVAAAILGTLAAIYNRDVLMQWAQNIIDPKQTTGSEKYFTREELIARELPTDKNGIEKDISDFELTELKKRFDNTIKGQTERFIKEIQESRSLWRKLTTSYNHEDSLKEQYSGENTTTERGIAFWRALAIVNQN